MPNYIASPTCWILFCGAFILTLLLTPLVIRLARRAGAVDLGGYRKINKLPTPLMGGLAIALPFLGVCALGLIRPTSLFALLQHRGLDFLTLSAGGAAIVALGVYDDIKSLGAKKKFLVQILVALLFCASGNAIKALDLPLVGRLELGSLVGSGLTVLWLVGVMNAYNLIDGLDGLAAGLALIGAAGLGVLAALNGATFIVLLCLALCGSLAAFLLFNFHPAKIFLGDTGSLFLGFILAALALLGASRASGSVMLLAPVLALGLPIFDTLSSMLRRILRGRSPFQGDRSHTHHRLLDYGWSQRQAAIILYAVALMCAVTAILCQVFYPTDKGPLFAIGFYAVLVMGVARVNGYLRPRQFLRVAACRKRNVKLAAFRQYASLILKSEQSAVGLEDILRLGCKELKLRFMQVGYENDPDFIAFMWPENETRERVVNPSEPIDQLRVKSAGEEYLIIRYQLDHPVIHPEFMDEHLREQDKLEHQDVMACLAHLFSDLRLDLLVAPARPVSLARSALTGTSNGKLQPTSAYRE